MKESVNCKSLESENSNIKVEMAFNNSGALVGQLTLSKEVAVMNAGVL